MAIDRPSDIQQTSPSFATPGSYGYEERGRGMSASLTDQTPGLDPQARLRNMAMRPVSYARERPAIVLSIVGGMIVLGIGTWLALRSRRPTRWDLVKGYGRMAKDHGVDALDWVRSKF
jgi:hypothetical protein